MSFDTLIFLNQKEQTCCNIPCDFFVINIVYSYRSMSQILFVGHLYRRTQPSFPTHTNRLPKLSWFSLTPSYGSCYGPIICTYKTKKTKKLRLLNLGSMEIRRRIVKKYPELSMLLDPDEQYSGGRTNKKIHKKIMQHFHNQFDGTIIREIDLSEKDRYDLEGVTEIVLWKFKNIRKL